MHELVQLHGGSIEAHSRLGEGSVFAVRIPLGTQHLLPEQVRAASALQPTSIGAEAFVQEALRWLPQMSSESSSRSLVHYGAPAPGDRRFAATFGAGIVLADFLAILAHELRNPLAPICNASELLCRALREPSVAQDCVAAAVIEVRDNGMGISPDLLPRVFDLFVQGDRTLDRAEGGLGIGLPVVRKLIEMHGRLGPRPQRRRRTRRYISDFATGDCSSTASPTLPQLTPTLPMRIFIVDDNADGADSLAMLLELDGHATRAVHSPQQALTEIESFKPELVLLDIGLPQMDGYELLKRLRPLPSLSGARFIAMTGYGQEEDRARTRAEGFDDHLVKPVSVEALSGVLGARPSAS